MQTNAMQENKTDLVNFHKMNMYKVSVIDITCFNWQILNLVHGVYFLFVL